MNEILDLEGVSFKRLFLNNLLSKGKYKYCRYNGLPLRYAGGKSLGVGHIIEHIPESVSTLMSPFFGGGSVEIACAKELGIQVTGYDVFDILVNYWQVQLNSGVDLAEHLQQWEPSKEQYAQVKERLKSHWNQESLIQDILELAAHYWFNHNLSYGPGFLGWMSKIYEEPKRYTRAVQKVKDFQCPLLSVKSGSFEETMPCHDRDFLYCDPPYYLDEGKMFRGIYPQRNFPVHH